MFLRRLWYFCLFLFLLWFSSVVFAPRLFKKLYFSPVLYSRDSQLLAAKVSLDGQWRFPLTSKISEKYLICLKEFEDQRFDYHFGIDPIALVRAVYQNAKYQRIKSGGSTITMQLARLLLGNPPRTILNKIKESWFAIGLEFNFNKRKILEYYSAVAPYGGNVVGIQAAIWRYFQRSTEQLSWAEAALLAVLPNQPSSIHLEKNIPELLRKRNALLYKLYSRHVMDKDTYELSLLESMPQKVFSMPQTANLLLEHLMQVYPDQYYYHSTIRPEIQTKFNEISTHYAKQFRENEIHNLAILLVDNRNREVVSYIGNSLDTSGNVKNGKVNNIHAPRSSGSILKPLLYAASLDRGLICPQTLIPDIPTLIAGFRPENFSRKYSGATPASKCIQQSLNVPAVRLLQWYGLDLFYKKLVELGFENLFRPSEDYGLSLILGGAEVTAWDLAKVYSRLSNQLLSDHQANPVGEQLQENDISVLTNNSSAKNMRTGLPKVISNAAIYEMIRTMQGVELPEGLSSHYYLQNQRKIAWKTGTSFGFKDAWCVGITPEYTMVVWVGNSSGLGRPGLIGVYTAAPMLFELFQSMDISGEWLKPYDEMHKVVVCRQSGFPPSLFCPETDTIWNPAKLDEMNVCPYHQQIYLDSTKKFRVYKNCDYYARPEKWFSLPPVMEYFYKLNHLEYRGMPPIRKDCVSENSPSDKSIEFIYPDKGIEVFIPVDLDELVNKIILKAAHKNPNANLYWFMDNSFLGLTTKSPHEWAIEPSPGVHYLKISDDSGQSATAVINCFRRKR